MVTERGRCRGRNQARREGGCSAAVCYTTGSPGDLVCEAKQLGDGRHPVSPLPVVALESVRSKLRCRRFIGQADVGRFHEPRPLRVTDFRTRNQSCPDLIRWSTDFHAGPGNGSSGSGPPPSANRWRCCRASDSPSDPAQGCPGIRCRPGKPLLPGWEVSAAGLGVCVRYPTREEFRPEGVVRGGAVGAGAESCV